MKQAGCIFFFLLLYITALGQRKEKLSKAEKDFETFWQTFADNYAFFKLKGVNWDSTYAKYRPLVTKRTKEKELIAILEQMVTPLKDGHITIAKGENIIYKWSKPSYFKNEFKGMENEFWIAANTTLMQHNFFEPKGVGPVFKGQHLYYFSKTNETGYIRISRCFGEVESLFDNAKEVSDTKLMLSLFDSLLAQLSGTKALLIDIRANGGGHGGLELASRLIHSRTLTHFKAIKLKGSYHSFSTPEPQYLEPNSGTKYLKPIFLLINDRTASSAEDFTISLYRQPHVTTIGTNTSGMLSDMYEAKLSSQISFTLSNQVYYSTTKEVLEDVGITPTIQVKNTRQEIERKEDRVILKALQVIKARGY